MIALSMNGTYETRTHWADKIALLGFFAASLLIAHFIVLWRSAIVLSKPIGLDYGGLSVSLPTGNGWRGEKQWSYQRNSFTLSSLFVAGAGSVTALVSCQYLLVVEPATAEMLFERKASASDGVIAETGQIKLGGPVSSFTADSKNRNILTIDWAHIRRPKTAFDTFFGVMQLPSDHRLEIEVSQTVGDVGLAEAIFKSVIESLSFADSRPLEAGSEVVAEIKGRGLDSFLASPEDGRDRESFFLIKDVKGHPVGFTMEVLGIRFAERPQNGNAIAGMAPEDQLNVLAGSFYYFRRKHHYMQATFFRGSNNLGEFIWKSETNSQAGRSGTELVMGEDGIMTVKKFDRRTEEKSYRISSLAIPDVLGEFIFSQMLDSDRKEVFIDIIEPEGRVIPAVISRMEAPHRFVSEDSSSEGGSAGGEAAYAFRVKLLDGRGFAEQVYLDDQRRVSGRLLQQEDIYTLERAGTENILKEFPEQGGYILQRKDKILEQGQLQENNE